MGVGGAFIMPSTLSILTARLPRRTSAPRRSASGPRVAGLGIAIGPVAGGWLVEHADWSWIFLVNLPFVVAALLARPLRSSPSRATRAAPRLDLPGFALSTAGLTALVWGIIEAPDARLDRPAILAALRRRRRSSLAAFAAWELRSPRADARRPAVPQPALLGRERRDHAGLLRAVRRRCSSSRSTCSRSSATARSRPACACSPSPPAS